MTHETPNADRPTAGPTMRDVSHTPPVGESVTNVWARGHRVDEPTDRVEQQASD